MVRWGIIGLGRIADTEIAPAITASPQGELRGVVSRDQGRAEAFAGRHGAARALTSFGELLADPGVDAVYIATPNALHADEVVAAAAGAVRRGCPAGGRRVRAGRGAAGDHLPDPVPRPLRPAPRGDPGRLAGGDPGGAGRDEPGADAAEGLADRPGAGG